MRRSFGLCLFIVVSCLTASCYDCGPNAEPTVEFHIALDSAYGLQKVRAVGAKSDSAFEYYESLPRVSSYRQYPISLLQDTTAFIFYGTTRVDTLTLLYERIFSAQSKCGYYVDIESKGYKSTFEMVWISSESYLGEIDYKRAAFPGGMRVFVSNRKQ